MKILLIEIEIYIFAEAAASSCWQADKNSKVVTGITNFAPFFSAFSLNIKMCASIDRFCFYQKRGWRRTSNEVSTAVEREISLLRSNEGKFTIHAHITILFDASSFADCERSPSATLHPCENGVWILAEHYNWMRAAQGKIRFVQEDEIIHA